MTIFFNSFQLSDPQDIFIWTKNSKSYSSLTGYPGTTSATDNNKPSWNQQEGIECKYLSWNNLPRISLIRGKLFPDRYLLPMTAIWFQQRLLFSRGSSLLDWLSLGNRCGSCSRQAHNLIPDSEWVIHMLHSNSAQNQVIYLDVNEPFYSFLHCQVLLSSCYYQINKKLASKWLLVYQNYFLALPLRS